MPKSKQKLIPFINTKSEVVAKNQKCNHKIASKNSNLLCLQPAHNETTFQFIFKIRMSEEILGYLMRGSKFRGKKVGIVGHFEEKVEAQKKGGAQQKVGPN